MARFAAAADPDGSLRPSERERMAAVIRRGWFTHLSWSRGAGKKPMTLTDFLARYAPGIPDAGHDYRERVER